MSLELQIEAYLDQHLDTNEDAFVGTKEMATHIAGLVSKSSATDAVTPLEGTKTAEEHSAFIMRVFMHLVAISPQAQFSVDLRNVQLSTQGKQMYVNMDGPAFTARVVKEFIISTDVKGSA